jgi:hypothetical protein
VIFAGLLLRFFFDPVDGGGFCTESSRRLGMDMTGCWKQSNILLFVRVIGCGKNYQGSIIDRDDFSLHHRSGVHVVFCPLGTGPLSQEVKRPGRETDLYPVPRLKMHGVVLILPPRVFMAWCLLEHRENVTSRVTRFESWMINSGSSVLPSQ